MEANRCAKHQNHYRAADRPNHATNYSVFGGEVSTSLKNRRQACRSQSSQYFSRRSTSSLFRQRRDGVFLFIFVAPDMKRVGEHDIAHQAAGIIVAEVERGIELEIAGQVASKSNRR